MTERGILFSAPMVRSLLANRKTMTRRIVKLPADAGAVTVDPGGTIFGPGPYLKVEATAPDRVADVHPRIRCPQGYPGDVLWVKEAIQWSGADCTRATYVADGEPSAVDSWPWKRPMLPSMFMPRGASRITLEIVSVRVERLHAITEEDARAEGIDTLDGELDDAAICRAAKVLGCCIEDRRASYGALWAEINGEASLIANPMCWAISFKRIEAP